MIREFEHDIFLSAPIAILCEDWSGVRSFVLEKLSEGVKDFDAYLDAHPEFVFEVRQRHSVIDANPVALELLGVSCMAELSRNVHHLLPADVSSNGQVLRAMARGDTHCQGERRLRRPDGTIVPLLWRVTLPVDGDGFDRLYFFAVDITQEKKAEEALNVARTNLGHAARLSVVGELTASVAHEMSQPIGAISSYAGALARWLSGDEPNIPEALASAARIGTIAKHAAQILRRIKDFSRRQNVEPVRLIPRKLILDAADLFECEAHRHKVGVEIDAPDHLPLVLGDPTQIQQVIVNIAVNAIQAMANSGQTKRTISIRTEASEEGWLVFSIGDSGPGIQPNAVEQIFEPFYSTKKQGVGLGLAICRRIVEDHGGRLWLDSRSPGALFKFSLPLASTPVNTGMV